MWPASTTRCQVGDLAGQQRELAEEPPSTMTGNNLLRPLVRWSAHNVDSAFVDHHEVYRLVPRPEYRVTHRHILRSAVGPQPHELLGRERWKGFLGGGRDLGRRAGHVDLRAGWRPCSNQASVPFTLAQAVKPAAGSSGTPGRQDLLWPMPLSSQSMESQTDPVAHHALPVEPVSDDVVGIWFRVSGAGGVAARRRDPHRVAFGLRA
jgi:hypothetical protein